MVREDVWVVGGASVFLLLGGWIFGLGVRNAWRALASPEWPKSPGIVVTSDRGSHVTQRGLGVGHCRTLSA